MLKLLVRLRLGRRSYRRLKDLWFFLAVCEGIAEARIPRDQSHEFIEALKPLVGK